jgi:hypothetical protein
MMMLPFLLLGACGQSRTPDLSQDDALMCSLEERPEVCYRAGVAMMQPPEDWDGADSAMYVACEADYRDSCSRWAEVSEHLPSLDSLYRNGLPVFCKRGNANACAAYLQVEPSLPRESPEDAEQIRARAASAEPQVQQQRGKPAP